MERETHVLDHPGCESPRTSSKAFVTGNRGARGKELRDAAADHERHQPVEREFGTRTAAHHFTVAENDDVVAQPQHVVEVVGDVDERQPAVPELVDQREEPVRFAGW